MDQNGGPAIDPESGAEGQTFITRLLICTKMRFQALFTGRRLRRQLFFVSVVIAGGLVLISMNGDRSSKVPIAASAKERARVPGDPPALVVHLDLKGSPPTMPFLKSFLELIAEEGADGLLLEYEDTFPFEGPLVNLSAPHAYTKEQVLQLLEWAAELRLQVIPLVQTFGHLEYALKLPEFSHLRESKESMAALCPLHTGTMALVEDMLVQVMHLHLRVNPPARFLHIGCDEVILQKCVRCNTIDHTSTELFLGHVTRVAQAVHWLFPGVKPLIWDDMLRRIPHRELVEDARRLASLVEPVVWVYDGAIAPQVTPSLWYTYGSMFARVWGAAAFRGASGRAAPAPHLAERLGNVGAWRRRQLGPPGEPRPAPAALVLTGWARYSHFEVLCELLPVAVPSLVLSLLAAREEEPLLAAPWLVPEAHAPALLERWRRRLRCPPGPRAWPALQQSASHWELGNCSFLGSDAFQAVAQCERALEAAASVLQRPASSSSAHWAPWNFLKAERGAPPPPPSPPLRGVRRASQALGACRAALAAALPRYVHAAALEEWLEERVEPARRLLERFQAAEGPGAGTGAGPAPQWPEGDVRQLGLQRRWWPPAA